MALMGASTLVNAGQEKQGSKSGKGGHSGGEHPGREEMMKRFDADGDGRLNEAERAALRSEMEKRHSKRPDREKMMKKYDTDGDGQLSEEERSALRADMEKRRGKHPGRKEMMEKFDTDGDGTLSEEERATMFDARRQEREPQAE